MNINGKTEVLGLFGNPIQHTMSPVIHNMLSEELGINEVYVPFLVENDIKSASKGAFSMNVKGVNVTVPYKQDVIPCLAEIDEDAEKIGAVNTLVRTKNGYKGYNTDMMGLTRALYKENISLKDKKIIILGAGGASRAVCYMCLRENAARVYLINRTFEKAEELSDSINSIFATDKIVPVAAKDYVLIPQDEYIMFQCTSMGLKPEDGLLIDDDNFYDMAEYGYDLIYNPAVTPFLREMNKRNIPYANGITMLLYQGVIAYELWNNISVNEDICQKILNQLRRNIYGDNLILVGYMGSGKTTVGKFYAKKNKMEFIDTDLYIESNEQITINEIFKRVGEAGFRKMETGMLEELSKNTFNSVISTGGGIVLNPENVKIIQKLGKVVFLNASSEQIYERIKDDTTRPLLATGTVEEKKQRIKEMLDKRMPFYSNAANNVIMVDGKSPENIVNLIEETIK